MNIITYKSKMTVCFVIQMEPFLEWNGVLLIITSWQQMENTIVLDKMGCTVSPEKVCVVILQKDRAVVNEK
jgi:hypothetical protein